MSEKKNTPEALVLALKAQGITNLDQLVGIASRHIQGPAGEEERWAFIVKGKIVYRDDEVDKKESKDK